MPCPICEGKDRWTTTYAEVWVGKFGKKKVLKFTFDKCPKYHDCGSKGLTITTMIEANYCPECGKKLNKEEKDDTTRNDT